PYSANGRANTISGYCFAESPYPPWLSLLSSAGVVLVFLWFHDTPIPAGSQFPLFALAFPFVIMLSCRKLYKGGKPMEAKLTTLCYLQQQDEWLMLNRNKKAKDDNWGKWIGVGGKFLPKESPEECMRREVR